MLFFKHRTRGALIHQDHDLFKHLDDHSKSKNNMNWLLFQGNPHDISAAVTVTHFGPLGLTNSGVTKWEGQNEATLSTNTVNSFSYIPATLSWALICLDTSIKLLFLVETCRIKMLFLYVGPLSCLWLVATEPSEPSSCYYCDYYNQPQADVSHAHPVATHLLG